jgi:hypothetical protein
MTKESSNNHNVMLERSDSILQKDPIAHSVRSRMTSRKKIMIAVIVLLILIAGFLKLRSGPATVARATQAQPGNADAPLKSVDLNQTYTFAGLTYTLVSAEQRNTIIINGQQATAAPGKVFFILNLKLKNDSNQDVVLNARDFIRLNVNNNADWLAPDIHNDPVTVQAISTKMTRVGFPLNTKDAGFRLQVGEIKGPKTVVPVNF